MSKRGVFEFISDIREAILRIEKYIKTVSYDDFIEDIKTQDAVIRNIEIIGEAAKNISADFRKRYPAVPWKELSGVRDRLIHHYFGVNLDIVWEIADIELKGVLSKIEDILRKK